MIVNGKPHSALARLVEACLFATSALAILATAGAGAALHAQDNPTSATNPFYGSVTAHPVSDAPLQLSLDDAVRQGLQNNLGLKQAEYQEHAIHGQKMQALQEFLPTITASADTGYYQH